MAKGWNKQQRFSLRKLSVGLVSTAIASFWMLGADAHSVLAHEQVSGQANFSVNYYYVTEDELTETEKAAVIHALPETREAKNTCYAMVYRPHQVATALPKTGGTVANTGLVPIGLGLTGIGLLVLVFRRSMTKKDRLVSVLLLSAAGSLLLTPEAQALKSELLSAYNQQFEVMVGEALPTPMDIEGYLYVGYIEKTCSSTTASNSGQHIASSLSSQAAERVETPISVTEPQNIAVPQDIDVPIKFEIKSADTELPSVAVIVTDQTHTDVIPFTEVTVYSDDLYEGETNVQEGQAGQRTIVTRVHKVGEEILKTEEVSNEVTLAPLPRVTTIGTKAKVKAVPPVAPTASEESVAVLVSDQVHTEMIPFTEVTVYSDNLYEGETSIQEGQAGQRTIVTRVHKAGEEILKTEEVSNDVTVEPVDAIKVVGTKKRTIDPEITSVEQSQTEAIPFETQEIETDDLPEGERVITNPGKEGLLTIVTRKYMKGDVVVNQEEISREVTQKPVSQLVHIGAKVDKTLLQLERNQENLTKQADAYLNADPLKQQAYNQALIAAQAVLDNERALKADVQSALTTLETARLALDGRLKIVPTFTIGTLTKDENGKKVSLTFAYTDPDQASLERKVSLYKDNQLVKEVHVADPSVGLDLTDLDYYQEYTVQTSLAYNIGKGRVTELETDKESFRLEYKKIEFKDIDQLELYVADGNQYKRKLTFDSLPSDPSAYFIKLKSDRYKEALLPIKTIRDNGTHYELTVAFDELVQEEGRDYKENFRFAVAKPETGANVYTNFASLVEAMRQNPTGSFILGANMTASDLMLAADAQSYVPNEFKGILKGQHNGKSFAIYDLAKPLFQSLNGATIGDLDFKDVAIETNQVNTGALANTAQLTQISNLAVQGQITAKQGHIGGLVGTINSRVTLDNALFKGSIDVKANPNSSYRVGGLAGNVTETSRNASDFTLIRSSVVDALITMSANNRIAMGSGLVGSANVLEIENSYAKGSIRYAGTPNQTQQRLDGIVVKESSYVNSKNTASEMELTGTNYEWANPHSKAELANHVANLKATVSLEDSLSPFANLYSVDYMQLANATPDRAIAYHNTEKLTPFYNKEYIVYYGNKIDPSDKLYTTKLVDVVPMIDKRIVTDIASEKSAINQLMLHYADGTIAYLPIIYKEDFKNKNIAEYQIVGRDVRYTPEVFLSSYDDILAKVLPSLSTINFDGSEVKEALGMTDKNKLSDLYLAQSFEQVKSNLAANLRKALSMNQSVNSLGGVTTDYVAQKLTDHKAEFLLGLAYLNRWYTIPFGEIQTKDLTMFKNDFFGNNNTRIIDSIIKLGKSGFANLQPKNNIATYKQLIGADKGQATVFNLLEAYKDRFLPNKTANEWLKETTKAYVVETPSGIEDVRNKQLAATGDSKYSIGLYDRIKLSTWENQNLLLPLITLPDESVYVITNMTSLSFGGYERYTKDQLPVGKDAKQYVRDLVDRAAIWQRDHFDFWYKVLTPETREKLFRNVANYDGYYYPNADGTSSWRTADASEQSISEFFGPSGLWYPERDGLGAYATGNVTYFVQHRTLDQLGTATFTHEMVHNLDGDVYFEGHGRREGQGAELFALGLLQAPDTLTQQSMGINHVFTEDAVNGDRLHVANPNARFNSAQDLQDYMHGVFDVIYLLDYLEANALLKQSDAVKQAWLRKIGNSYVNTSYGKQSHAGNTITPLTLAEVSQLKNLNDLIDQNIINRREYYDQANLERNGYYLISLFSPIYAALDNPTGAPGDLMFRRMAFELLAAKGYQKGFVPYVSQKLGDQALAQGDKNYSSWFRKDVGVVNDSMVLKDIFGDEYQSWSDFKKAMYQERINQLSKLKPVSIRYILGRNTSRTTTYTGYDALQKLMDEAVAYDAKNLSTSLTARGSWVNVLKKRIFNAYLRDTNDFTSSIFN